MPIPFCDYHIVAFLTEYERGKKPLDISLAQYFKAHKSLGSKDRKQIGDAVYEMVRWKSLLEKIAPTSSLDKLQTYRSSRFQNAKKDLAFPESMRLGISDFLFEKLKIHFGIEETRRLASVLNTQAPMTVRANLLKTTRESLMQLWQKYPISPCMKASAGIQFQKRFPVFSFPEFKEGLFEVQDEGSQLVASLIRARPGETVLDFCSGAGGKTLAFAPCMNGRGQIYLHDIREEALFEAKKRLKRAGIQNAQCLPPGHPSLAKLKGKCDWVLIDVPCTGSGTFRRNPDQKWRLDAFMLERLVLEQRTIAKEAIPYLKKGGQLVYATCSLLPEENETQVDFLLKNYPLTLVSSPLHLLPEEGGMDGFLGATFQKIE